MRLWELWLDAGAIHRLMLMVSGRIVNSKMHHVYLPSPKTALLFIVLGYLLLKIMDYINFPLDN